MVYIENIINSRIQYTFLGNSIGEYIFFLFSLTFLISFIYFLKKIAIKNIFKIENIKEKKYFFFLSFIDDLTYPLAVLVGFYTAIKTLNISENISFYLNKIFFIAVVYVVVKTLNETLDLIEEYVVKKRRKELHVDTSLLPLSFKVLKIFVWFIAFLFILSNFGINIVSFVASAGVAGVAIALAAQSVLSDFFGSLSIYFDRPFKVNDFIIVGEHMGTVANVGIKSTRITSITGEEIVISNKDITNQIVKNFGRLKRRRTNFSFSVTYETPHKKVNKIPEMIEKLIKKIELAQLERVHFKSFGESGLEFEVVYYILSSSYNDYVKVQHQMNIDLIKVFEKEKINFAYPVRKLFLDKNKKIL